jgi:hypothetical protein
MKDTRVDAALVWLRDLPERERRRVAAGPFEAIAVLQLAGLTTEANMVYSVSHMVPGLAMATLQGVADERGEEAREVLKNLQCLCAAREDFHRTFAPGCGRAACGRLCLLVNQGPCGCVVPARAAELRRRQRALLWACEAILRPEPTGPGKGDLSATLGLFQRLCTAEAMSKSTAPNECDPGHELVLTDAWTQADRAHLRETAAAVRQRLASR